MKHYYFDMIFIHLRDKREIKNGEEIKSGRERERTKMHKRLRFSGRGQSARSRCSQHNQQRVKCFNQDERGANSTKLHDSDVMAHIL